MKGRNATLVDKLFFDHPHAFGETYWQHHRRALHFGVSMISAGAACLMHALLPAVFVRTASSMVQTLYDEMRATRRLGGIPHDRPSLVAVRHSPSHPSPLQS